MKARSALKQLEATSKSNTLRPRGSRRSGLSSPTGIALSRTGGAGDTMADEQAATGVIAPADAGVAPLVAALSQLAGIEIVGSGDGGEQRESYVSFRAGSEWRDLTDFAHCLTDLLKSSSRLSSIAYSLSIEWRNDWDDPLGYLRGSRLHIPALAEVISSIVADE
jgi:hypothetical protein